MRYYELFESIPLDLAKIYRTQWNPELYKNIFANWNGLKDKNAFRLYLPYDNNNIKQNYDIPIEIVNYLQDKGYEIQNYVSGIAKKINNKQNIKIGKLLADNPELKNIFDNDPQRALSKTGDKLVVISRHPYDISSQSTGRGWTSCMNLIDGSNNNYVLKDIKEGTLIAYLIKADDKNITNPISRILIKPFVNTNNPKDVALFAEGTQYGTPDNQFKEIVDKWIADINGPDKIGMYCLNPKLYNDNIEKYRYLNLDKATERVQIEAVKRNGLAIQYIKNPSELVQIEAVKQNGRAILYIENPSELVQIEAVKQDGWAIQDINNPSELVQIEAVKRNGLAIEFIKNPSERVQIEAVKRNGWAIEHIKNPSERVQIEAVKQNEYAIRVIKNPSELVQIEAVKQNEYAIRVINNPSELVQIEAVKRNGWAIEHIKNPSELVQIEAVKQNGYAIQYIKNPSERVQIEAVKQNKLAIQYIKNPSKRVQIEAER